ncbi:hypothetical protein EPUS_02857 [Endocarpon pusillum Z07020]|uniref:U3 small nucleolar RNA-associated protein 10 n=1 Tax=Endocarpon pusillum (strain Z07020 / HMAS-L-300199) TaxID=1263415 RepID=U1HQ85_ENDPU|nr:uncharacterized protein EPUS_02857 [Endocarpon pusillum Z07020]ERF72575.1 hypothetical protein EPUS_02857 [Endocarpon pusillum Z07020]
MASSFAAQLKEIAAKSKNELDLKAHKTAHSQSLIFAKKIAGTQDFDTIYQLCLEGFEDLCKIDPRFQEYQRNLFSQQSKTQERDLMTAEQNATLDTVLEGCLGLLGGRLLLSPARKVAEWLVRRFRVHEYNTSFFLLTFLPYHATPFFRNLLSILPSPLAPQFKFLVPYIPGLTNPPRHAIAYGAINNDGFFAALNTYALKVCHAGSQHQTLLSFWASIIAEAIAGRLDLAKSGRKEIQRQRQEDVLLKILPLLKDGLSMHEIPEMMTACFTFAILLASKSQLANNVLDSLMEAVTGALKKETMDAGLICLSIMTQQKSEQFLNRRVITKLSKVNDLEKRLQAFNKSCDIEGFTFAIVQSALSDVRAKGQKERLDLVERLLWAELMDSERMIRSIASLIVLLKSASQNVDLTSFRDTVADLLRRLNDSERFSSLVPHAVQQSGVDSANLEASLEIMIEEPQRKPAEVEEMDVDSDTPGTAPSPLDRALKHVPQRTVEEHSFLSPVPSHLFPPLLEAFTLAAQSKEGLEKFLELPLWKLSKDTDEPLFASFFVRVFSGPYSIQVRIAALGAVQNFLSQLSNSDPQAILPYVLPQLADPAQRIRRAASEVLLAMEHALPSAFVDGETFKQWGAKDLYGSGKIERSVSFQPTQDVSKILQRAVLPLLEECILDPTEIRGALKSALRPSSGDRVSSKTKSIELKKYLRQSFFRLLLTHLSSTPLYSVKCGLLNLLSDVEKLGGISKRKELMPLLLRWASLSYEDVETLAAAEHLDKKTVNVAMCSIISPTDEDAVKALLGLTFSSNKKRSDFAIAVSERIQSFWPQLKTDRQIAAADALLKTMFSEEAERGGHSQLPRSVFNSVELSTDVLIHLLNNVRSSMDEAKEHSPASKRRRTNESQAVPVNKSLKLAIISKATFVLELIDNSSPESRPQLLSSLSDVFMALHQVKLQHQSDMSYLLSLSLGSLLSIVRNAASHASKLEKLDVSRLQVDVIMDCVRTTPSPQVQNTALLLIAATAKLLPERILDSIMPVFTFMGSNVLGKEDEYSNYVVDQTMDQIIPAMIEAVRGKGQDLVGQTSDLVFSFVVAFEHIPPHRRLRLFKKLVSNLGDEVFLSILISSLTKRYPNQDDVNSFIVTLTNTFDADIQLETCVRLVGGLRDALAGQPNQYKAVTDAENVNGSMSPLVVLSLLRTLDRLFSESNIKPKIARFGMSVKNGKENLTSTWKSLLDQMIRLVQTPDLDQELSTTVNSVLSSLLRLVPITTFVSITEHFLVGGPDIIKERILRLLRFRLHAQNERTSALQAQLMAFLQILCKTLTEPNDEAIKHAALECIDCISELYGRKDAPAMVQTGRVISEACLKSSELKLATLALLCLSSIADSVKEAIVPITPQVIPKVFGLVQFSLQEEAEHIELHNAAFALLSGVLTHVPFIFSMEHLDQILVLCAESRNALLNTETHELLEQALRLVGSKIELAKIVGSLRRTWNATVENDLPAVQQALALLLNSIQTSSKSLVANQADKISELLLQAFDLRRIQFTNISEDSYTNADVIKVEQTVNAVTIEFIYKLNDTTFRPIFHQMLAWATKCPDVKPVNLAKAQKLRQTTLFNFLAHFFGTLKSIVTSYASHVVEPAMAALKEISSAALSSPPHTSTKAKKRHLTKSPSTQDQNDEKDTTQLYTAILATLRAALTHDHDAHFSNPALFHPLSEILTEQLHLASHPTYTPYIPSHTIPTIVRLAVAVVDTPEHLKRLNSLICALRRSEDAKVRSASVKLHLALAGAETLTPPPPPAGEGEGAGDEEVGIAEEWCGTVLSVGEGMVYVNEMLEDEDEEVERGIRRLVRRVREVVGEEGIFE